MERLARRRTLRPMPARRPARAARRVVLVSAGPTREAIDPVRFLSNESSGRMGFAIAEAAARAGHEVVLVAGPVGLATPRGVRRVDVVDARQLLAALRREWRRADVVFMAAAVADWRPARRLAGKWRAKDGGSERATIELVRNPDVLATLTGGRRSARRTVVAFALETGRGEARARRKLAQKGADYVVLNDAGALNATRSSIHVLGADGSTRAWRDRPKATLARALVRLVDRRAAPRESS
jgi:phosphopantothenoylcysteine decarboxylase / phosphopantothenate---cysteine ligase